jgi:hypothetical protein
MASDETVSPHDRIEAEKAGCEVAVAIVKLQFEEPIISNDVCVCVCSNLIPIGHEEAAVAVGIKILQKAYPFR